MSEAERGGGGGGGGGGEQTEAAGGDMTTSSRPSAAPAPRPQPAAGPGASLWNTGAWLWESKNLNARASTELRQRLASIEISGGGVVVRLTEVARLTCEAQLHVRRGTRVASFDVSFIARWEGWASGAPRPASTPSGRQAGGEVSVSDVMQDDVASDFGVEVKMTTISGVNSTDLRSKEIARAGLPLAIRAQMRAFAKMLDEAAAAAAAPPAAGTPSAPPSSAPTPPPHGRGGSNSSGGAAEGPAAGDGAGAGAGAGAGSCPENTSAAASAVEQAGGSSGSGARAPADPAPAKIPQQGLAGAGSGGADAAARAADAAKTAAARADVGAAAERARLAAQQEEKLRALAASAIAERQQREEAASSSSSVSSSSSAPALAPSAAPSSTAALSLPMPLKVEAAGAAPASSTRPSEWNQGGWAWETRDVSAWARVWVRQALSHVELDVPPTAAPGSFSRSKGVDSALATLGAFLRTDEPGSVSVEASVSLRRGKKLPIFEIAAEIPWEGSLVGHDGEVLGTGDGIVRVEGLDQDTALDGSYTCVAEGGEGKAAAEAAAEAAARQRGGGGAPVVEPPSPLDEKLAALMQQHGVPMLKRRLAAFVEELLAQVAVPAPAILGVGVE